MEGKEALGLILITVPMFSILGMCVYELICEWIDNGNVECCLITIILIISIIIGLCLIIY